MVKHNTKLFKALSNQTRIDIVCSLATRKESSCQELMKKFSLSQPTLSHHFNKLIDAKIIQSRRDGVLWYYKLNKSYLKEIGIDINKFADFNNHEQ
jgi:ArsR family transcriptional regulator